jgi:transcriptional regulator with XRE-family HTH domain
MRIDQAVRTWREAAGLTQAAAAAQVGITQAAWSRVESGARFPDESTAAKLIAAGVFTAEEWGRAAIARAETGSEAVAAA